MWKWTNLEQLEEFQISNSTLFRNNEWYIKYNTQTFVLYVLNKVNYYFVIVFDNFTTYN